MWGGPTRPKAERGGGSPGIGLLVEGAAATSAAGASDKRSVRPRFLRLTRPSASSTRHSMPGDPPSSLGLRPSRSSSTGGRCARTELCASCSPTTGRGIARRLCESPIGPQRSPDEPGAPRAGSLRRASAGFRTLSQCAAALGFRVSLRHEKGARQEMCSRRAPALFLAVLGAGAPAEARYTTRA